MKPIERAEVLGLAEYETIRDRFRARVIEEKKARRLRLGEHASCVFENRDTVLMQIQEMLRTERITREASVLHEVETYNELIPRAHELSATILVEIEDKDVRERFLLEAKGLEREFSLVIDGARCPGKNDPSREHPERTTAVHYVKFDLAPEGEAALRSVLEKKRKPEDVVVELVSTHPRYTATTRLSPALVTNIADDLG
ncbi:MAG: hypothetical protein BGO98_09435 [Myxococcales bacterium 68-20]|nr:MAG: hypothetical protein BGO98_09435 [Myxococcales bacterium 68-20]